MARCNLGGKADALKQQVRGFIPPQNDAERFLMRHIEDMANFVQKRGVARYSGFLSDREQMLAQAAVPSGTKLDIAFVGGAPDAERKILCLTPIDEDAYPPIACVEVSLQLRSGAAAPQHKDYLGSLMSLSFERTCLGDILLPSNTPDRAYLFVLESVLPVVLEELCSVANVMVSTRAISLSDLPDFAKINREMQTTTVSSLRLDAVLAAMLPCSRGMAADYIAAGRVEINHVPATRVHENVYAQDIFTVRGKGRFQLVSLQGKSKKDRFIIEYFRF